MRVGLVGCVKTKLARAAPAADLYISPLFDGRRAAVERGCDCWFVLSAFHGLVAPTDVIAPYDHTLTSASRAERRRWSSGVVEALREQLGDLRGITFEVHAGATYTDYGLVDGLEAGGAVVELPMRGLPLGAQLAWYRQPGLAAGRVAGAARELLPGRVHRGRYGPLQEYLESIGDDRITLRFDDLERILAAPLPASARRHRPWWGNNGSSPQAAAWLAAGFEVDAVDRRDGWVRFRRAR